MNNRIEEIRKYHKLSRANFGKRIGVSGDVINNLERGRVDVKDHIFKLICKEFNVNEDWLRTGEGEMFVEMSRDDELAEFFGMVQGSDDNSFMKQFMEVLKELDVEEWEVLAKMAVKMANKIKRD